MNLSPYEFYCLTPYEYWCKCEGYKQRELTEAYSRRFLAYMVYCSAPRKEYLSIQQFMPIGDEIEKFAPPSREEMKAIWAKAVKSEKKTVVNG